MLAHIDLQPRYLGLAMNKEASCGLAMDCLGKAGKVICMMDSWWSPFLILDIHLQVAVTLCLQAFSPVLATKTCHATNIWCHNE